MSLFSNKDQPTKGELEVSFDLSNQPDFYSALGELAMAATKMEFQLSLLFQLLSDSPATLSASIFYGMSNFRNKIEAVNGLAKILFPTGTYARADKALSNAYRAMKLRNRYIHNPYVFADGRVAHLKIGDGKVGTFQEVRLADIRDCTKSLSQASQAIFELNRDIEPKLPELLQEHRGQPGPTLRFARKGSPHQGNQRGRKRPPPPSRG